MPAMDLVTIAGIIIVVVLVVSLGRMLLHSLRTVFFVLLFILLLVFLFGVSIGDIFESVTRVLFMVF